MDYTYDRRVLRPNVTQWKADIQALYDAAASRSNSSMALGTDYGYDRAYRVRNFSWK